MGGTLCVPPKPPTLRSRSKSGTSASAGPIPPPFGTVTISTVYGAEKIYALDTLRSRSYGRREEEIP